MTYNYSMDTATNTLPDDNLYERDFHAWCEAQAALLRERFTPGANDGLDYANLAEEIESLGRSQRRALRSHMVILLHHLLKWRHQPDHRGASWGSSIINARAEIEYEFDDSPSLRRLVSELIEKAFPIAVRLAAIETQLPSSDFPASCPFSEDQVLDPDFLPSDLDGPANA